MSNHEHTEHQPQSDGGSWELRSGIALVILLIVGGLFLTYEHHIPFLAGYGLVAVLIALCFVAYLLVQGGRGHESH